MKTEMAVTAKLYVRLFAGDVLVAESDDPRLWQRVLLAVNEVSDGQQLSLQLPGVAATTTAPQGVIPQPMAGEPALQALADDIAVPTAMVQGACAPSREAPYLHLDPRSWEALRRSLPARGPGSIAPIVVAATLLALWGEHLGMPAPSVPDCLAVLRTINLRDPNTNRSLRNSNWLQLRNNHVFINPAERSRAIELARAFCAKDWPA